MIIDRQSPGTPPAAAGSEAEPPRTGGVGYSRAFSSTR